MRTTNEWEIRMYVIISLICNFIVSEYIFIFIILFLYFITNVMCVLYY